MTASKQDVVGWARDLADMAARLGAATVVGATASQSDVLAEVTAKVAHAALMLEHAFADDRPPLP